MLLVGVGFFGYSEWGRRVIYSYENKQTRYPGMGKTEKWKEAGLLVTPLGAGEAFFAPIIKKAQYQNEAYQVIEMLAQTKWEYVVGRVVGWERVVGSDDLYLTLSEGKNGERGKYRVGACSGKE